MIPEHIKDKIGTNLYLKESHPLRIISKLIIDHFTDFVAFSEPNPYVSVTDNFDSLLVPSDHPSRRGTDTFYADEKTVLRTHMTCYLTSLARRLDSSKGLKFLTCGDVYRKDAIDATHYPVFHQIDGFCLVDDNEDVAANLRHRLVGLIQALFGKECRYRFLEEKDDPKIYFPFTINSCEVEVEIEVNNEKKWVEVLGAGTVHPTIMKAVGLEGKHAWAFGMGLERLAMLLFEIPDIRLFWSTDSRFTRQFNDGTITKFQPFSKYEKCYKDIAFFVSPTFHYNELCSVVRDEDHTNLIEDICLLDEFKKGDKLSHCYRITYRSLHRTLTNKEIDEMQLRIRARIVDKLKVELR